MSKTQGSGAPARARAVAAGALAASVVTLLAAAPGAGARAFPAHPFVPGSVVIASTTYPAHGDPMVQLGQPLVSGTDAVAGGKYPEVFNNDVTADGSFAVETPINLLDVDPFGNLLTQTTVPTDQVTTSFSSKSELAVNFSTNGQDLSFLAYNAPLNALDASNSDTPGVRDTSPNPDTAGPYYRVAANLDSSGNWTFTDSNAYTGDNGRAVIMDNDSGLFYAAGNSNNGSAAKGTALLAQLAEAGGAQVFLPSDVDQADQTPPVPPTQLGTFSITEVPPNTKADKLGKDTNFRGLTIHDGIVYYTKGSGGNGIDTVYYVNTSGVPCTNGQGIPDPTQPLPTIAGSPYPMCILQGFPTVLASSTANFPFGIWFANDDTIYLGDEGDGNLTTKTDPVPYDDASHQTTAGLEKWTFNTQTNSWQYDYTITAGLNLGTPYTVPGYPTGTNAGTGEPWAPATDGLRNISGQLNDDGTATIYAATSTVSGSGDPGADPNEVVKVTDDLGDTTSPGSESFTTIAGPKSRVRYAGVAVVPANYGS